MSEIEIKDVSITQADRVDVHIDGDGVQINIHDDSGIHKIVKVCPDHRGNISLRWRDHPGGRDEWHESISMERK